jgi:uncharacterized RDD family membrane protein YckC
MSWYYAWNGQQAGPVEDAELLQLATAGTVTASTLIWRPGMDAWAPYSSLPSHHCLQCKQAFLQDRLIPLAGGLVCNACKPLVLQRIREGLAPLPSVNKFAGFWIRLIARMIDSTITSVTAYIFQIPMLIVLARMDKKTGPELPVFLGATALAALLSLGASAYYEAWFLKNKGATPGKMILGLKVIRARGGSFTWGLALGRYFAYVLGGFTLNIGYIMAAWDDEKRALHDRICDTRVVSGA